jgi:hypothetical protein
MLTVESAQNILIQLRATNLFTPEQLVSAVSLANRSRRYTPEEVFRGWVEMCTAPEAEPLHADDQIDHAEHAYWDRFERDEGCGGDAVLDRTVN